MEVNTFKGSILGLDGSGANVLYIYIDIGSLAQE